MKKMLVTRPDYDDATSYTFYYAGLVIKEAENRNVQVIDLKRPRLTQKNFTAIIENQNPSFIFFNSHGDEKTIYGDKITDEEEVLVHENENHHLIDSRLVYARTCCSTASLGRFSKDGCFIGYETQFKFWTDESKSTTPSSDKIAKLFLKPSNTIASSLLKGNTAKEAVSKSLNLTKKNILKLLKEKEEGSMVLISGLWNNMKGTVILGNENMSFG